MAIGVLGLVALAVAVLHDLPDARATGLIAIPAHGLRDAAAAPAIGLYLESLGAVALILTAAGLLLAPAPRKQGGPASATSAS
ncbi:MAG: hypothetical protein ABSH51_30755 [Solirubrobacteraceae bacterium]